MGLAERKSETNSAITAPMVTDDYPGGYVKTQWKLLAEKRLRAPDLSIKDIAMSMGYNHTTVRQWLRDPDYQRYENWVLAKFRGELIGEPSVRESTRFTKVTVGERFEEYQLSMQERLLDLIETTTNEKLQADLAEKWLRLSGVQEKGAQVNLGIHMSPDTLLIFMQRAKEAGLEVGALAGLISSNSVVEGQVL
jgi:hypothetical protein